jgi:predicted nicotinamide N-methyase
MRMDPAIEIRIQQLQIEQIELQFASVSNMEALFDALIAKGSSDSDFKDERIPYWADLWPSAIGLSRYLVQHQLIKKDQEVLELGCGLGLVGLVAGKMSARVHFTDYIQDALGMARYNWELNKLDTEASFDILDWRNPKGNFQPDWILAADVAYEKRILQPLIDTLQFFKKSGTRIILTEPGRQIGKDFLDMLTASGFEVRQEQTKVTLKGIETLVGIWELT